MNSSRKKQKLRTGFTTGAAAAAAAKGALLFLVDGTAPESVWISFIGGGGREIPIHSRRMVDGRAVCTVIKDAGDDPDITHRAEIGVSLKWEPAPASGIIITGGRGVGRVTKPGLEIPPGGPAINPGPQKMIRAALTEILAERNITAPRRLEVDVFVPEGEELSKKTLNSRLGILGGISILGTTGLVRPMSHAAYIATIASAMSVARACSVKRVYLTTGRRSEKHAIRLHPDEPAEAFIQIGDFFQKSLRLASETGMDAAVLTVFYGKALKMAYGFPHTHAAKSDMCMKRLTGWVTEYSSDQRLAREVRKANTARQAFFLLKDVCPEAIARTGREMIRSARKFASADMTIHALIMDFEGCPVYDSRKDDGRAENNDRQGHPA
ncbi:MAG: cobalamin biosynthesis protein CbiD [Desulfobacterales bacterium]|nr:MAG: cobalamin biosynthesis protein CbiD [Desulfobacterales bacterium]